MMKGIKLKLLLAFLIIGRVIWHPQNFWKTMQIKQPGKLGGLLILLFVILLTNSLVIFFRELLKGATFYQNFALAKSLRDILLFVSYYFISLLQIYYLQKLLISKPDWKLTHWITVCSIIPFLLISFVTALFPFMYPVEIAGLAGYFVFWSGFNQYVGLNDNHSKTVAGIFISINLVIFALLSFSLWKLSMYFY